MYMFNYTLNMYLLYVQYWPLNLECFLRINVFTVLYIVQCMCVLHLRERIDSPVLSGETMFDIHWYVNPY